MSPGEAGVGRGMERDGDTIRAGGDSAGSIREGGRTGFLLLGVAGTDGTSPWPQETGTDRPHCVSKSIFSSAPS